MGKKSKAKSKAKKGGAEDDDGEDPAPDEVIEEVENLFSALKLDGVASLVAKSLEDFPDSRRLAGLRDEADRVAEYVSASGIALCDGGAVGRGVAVAKKVKMGEAVLRERPLLLAPRAIVAIGRKEVVEDADVEAAEKAYGALKPVQRRLLPWFHGWVEPLPSPVAAVVARRPKAEKALRFAWVLALNSHEYQPEPAKVALYCLVARANHSCDPACTLDGNSDGELCFYALRDMEKGEEVLYSYLAGHFTLHTRETRQSQLKRVKFFDCQCARCVIEGSADFPWKFQLNGTDDEISMAQRMEPLLVKKAEALEALWARPEKDPIKYVSDWEALAKSVCKAMGSRHPVSGRVLFFATMAFNTGFALGGCNVDSSRHASALRDLGMLLLDYLDTGVPPGARKVLLEPFAQGIVLLAARSQGQDELIADIIRRAGRAELELLPWLDEKNIQLLRKTVASHSPAS